jgi:hypothetical protein
VNGGVLVLPQRQAGLALVVVVRVAGGDVCSTTDQAGAHDRQARAGARVRVRGLRRAAAERSTGRSRPRPSPRSGPGPCELGRSAPTPFTARRETPTAALQDHVTSSSHAPWRPFACGVWWPSTAPLAVINIGLYRREGVARTLRSAVEHTAVHQRGAGLGRAFPVPQLSMCVPRLARAAVERSACHLGCRASTRRRAAPRAPPRRR